MDQVIIWGAMVGIPLIVAFLSEKKKDGFSGQLSRGDFMRNLNKKMEKEQIVERKQYSRFLMKRSLSHIVIFSLLAISPVSFSTSEIPNFYILGTVKASLQVSRKTSIVVSHRVAETLDRFAAAIPSHQCFLFPNLPAVDSSRAIEHGRAPPVVLSA